jgi:uncharacterized protein
MKRFEVYRDVRGEWRWRMIAANGKIIGTSGEGYRDQRDCYSGLELLREYALLTEVVVVADNDKAQL